jgi:hypothetical protein
MTLGGIPTGPDPDLESIDERRFQAQLELAFVKRRDEVVERHERLAERADLTPERIRFWQQVARTQYVQLTGIKMEQRDEYLARLEEAAEYGHITVAEIRDAMRSDHRNLLPRVFVPSGAWSGLGVDESVASS